jgi:hypothetical protein
LIFDRLLSQFQGFFVYILVLHEEILKLNLHTLASLHTVWRRDLQWITMFLTDCQIIAMIWNSSKKCNTPSYCKHIILSILLTFLVVSYCCLFLVLTLRHTCARAVSVVNSEWHKQARAVWCAIHRPKQLLYYALLLLHAARVEAALVSPRHARAIVLPLLLPAPVWIWQFSDSKQSERTGLLR